MKHQLSRYEELQQQEAARLAAGEPVTEPVAANQRSKMTTAQKAAYISEHGKDAYLELPW
ncbi:MAG: hypothetical protein WDM77_06420 [Steroidobacteraceae bacterium]